MEAKIMDYDTKDMDFDTKIMDYDSALEEHVGQFGRFQIFAFILIGLVEMSSAFYNMQYVFIMATPLHWCKTPELQNMTLTSEQIKALSIPYDGKQFKSCKAYKRNYTNLGNVSYTSKDNGSLELKETYCEHGWDYDKSVYERSIVTEVRK